MSEQECTCAMFPAIFELEGCDCGFEYARVDDTQKALVAAVRVHAADHYDSPITGWDYVVEAYSDAEIYSAIKGVRTLNGAIGKLRPTLRAFRERDNEARSYRDY